MTGIQDTKNWSVVVLKNTGPNKNENIPAKQKGHAMIYSFISLFDRTKKKLVSGHKRRMITYSITMLIAIECDADIA